MKKLLIPLAIFLSTPAYAHIDCLVSELHDQGVFVGYAAELLSRHRVTITNTLGRNATYKYTFSFCVENEICKNFVKTITLYPTQNYTDVKRLTVDVKYHIPGDRKMTAYTYVEGDENGHIQQDAIVRIIK